MHRLETMWLRLRGFFRSVLGLTPSQNQIAAALLNIPPEAARERVTSMAVTALMAERERARLLRTPNNNHNLSTTTRDDVAGRPRPPAEVRESAIPGAGSGLFLRCDITANPGDFIAIYAGTYTPPAPPITPRGGAQHRFAPTPGDGGQYVINLEEGGYLDGATRERRENPRRRGLRGMGHRGSGQSSPGREQRRGYPFTGWGVDVRPGADD